MPVDLKKLPPVDPNANEDLVSKLWRLYHKPLAEDIPGVKDYLDKRATPGIADTTVTPRTSTTPPHATTSWGPMIHGFSTGALEAISPAILAQRLSLGHGLPAVVANTAMTAQGAKEASDSELPTWKRILGGLTAIASTAGVRSGLGKMSATTATPINPTGGLQVALEDLTKTKPGAATAETVAKQAAVSAEVEKNPGGKIAQTIWGEKGRPKPPSIVDKEKSAAEAAELLAKEKATGIKELEKEGTQLTRNEKARDTFVNKNATQEARNLNSRDKYISTDQAQTAKNLNARAKNLRTVEQARAAADTENASRQAANTKALEQEGTQLTRNEKARDAFVNKSAETEARNLNARDKYISTNEAQEARNLNARAKHLRDVEKSQAQAEAENVKRNDAVVTQANDEKQAATLAGLKDKLTEVHEPGAITETVAGPGEHGGTERATFRRMAPEPPKEGGGESGDITPDTPTTPTKPTEAQDTALSKIFKTERQAARAARAVGADSWAPVEGGYRIVFKGQGVSGAVQAARPFNKLSIDEQQALVPVITKAIENGYTGDMETLGDELAGRLGAIKEGQQMATDVGNTPDSLIDAVRKAGGISSKAETSQKGEIAALKQLFAKPGTYTTGSGGNLKAANGIFANRGLSLDQTLEAIKQTGQFPKINNINDLVTELDKAARSGTSKNAVDELTSGLGEKWWEPTIAPEAKSSTMPERRIASEKLPTGVSERRHAELLDKFAGEPNLQDPRYSAAVEAAKEPEMSVPEFAQELSKEGQKPIAEVPFALTADKAKSVAPAKEPSLFEQPSVKVKSTPEDVMEQTGVTTGQKPFEAGLRVSSPPKGVVLSATESSPTGKPNWARSTFEGEPTTTEIPTEPTSDDLTNMKPEDQEALLQEMVKRFKSSKGEIDPLLAARIGLGGVGAAYEGKQNDLGYRPLSIAAGGLAGFMGPQIYAKGIPPQAAEFMNKLHNTGLLSPLSVVKKAAGDVGGLTLAGVENPNRIGEMLRQFLTSPGRQTMAQNFREGFSGPELENMSGLENYIQNPKNPLSWSGRTMGGLTKATKGILGESGFSPQEQRYYTLTDYPSHTPTENLYNAVRGSQALQHLSPFARIGINRLERGWEYSPLGPITTKSQDTATRIASLKKAAIGTAAGSAAYQLTPDDFVKKHPLGASVAASLGGPLGLPILTGMVFKNTHKGATGSETAKNFGDAAHEISRDIPGLRLIEDLTGRGFPEGFLRNYLSGYTNVVRPLATMMEPDEPDLTSNNLSETQKITNRMLSNIPIVRGKLPRKGGTPMFGAGDATSPTTVMVDPATFFGEKK